VIRLTSAPVEDFERLSESAPDSAPGFREAQYPRGADPEAGRVFFRVHPGGAIVVDVDSRAWNGDSTDARVRELFSSGRAMFSSAGDLHDFCSGPLSRAFGRSLGSLWTPPPEAPLGPFVVEPAALARHLAERVQGQDAALATIAASVASQLGKRTPLRPAAILLLGPTGIGKTSAVEALPSGLVAAGYPRELPLHRVDCSELSEPHRVSQLLGAPPGYVGYGEDTAFLDALRRPGILLLDEIEKAHPVFLVTLLGLLDTGRVTSGNGATIQARDAIVFMTTNLGHDLEDELNDATLGHRPALREACRSVLLEEGFPPELVGRIGTVALFRSLDDETLAEIAAGAVRRLASEYGLEVAAVDQLVSLTVLDMAGTSGVGVRGLDHAATDLLGLAFSAAARHEPGSSPLEVLAGPPIEIRPQETDAV
jgi:hypothetical protein